MLLAAVLKGELARVLFKNVIYAQITFVCITIAVASFLLLCFCRTIPTICN